MTRQTRKQQKREKERKTKRGAARWRAAGAA